MPTYRIDYSKVAFNQLRSMRSYDSKKITSYIDRHLRHQPLQLEGLKKQIQKDDGNFIYQLTVGAWRVFYDVDDEVKIVRVEKLGHKGRKTTREIL